ncbi:DUF305 domain-containing protein [Microbacterium sp. CFBP9034]|uniref:DUF305 domain-containing protein n=1 Tax=Microbacterium sp. CFBP9034 TaxID=3096540 RepID=UPI002A6AF2AB|nr:DUF305 domain-containing protein [Microbacterium sp. CFBP9034]MDY0910623.1 DUF305 domain-containing protein [Microbacterium sp. CFBP9034]
MRIAVAAVGVVVAVAAATGAVALAITAAATGERTPTVLASAPGSASAEPVSESDFCFVESMIFYRVEAVEIGNVVLDTEGITAETRERAAAIVAEQSAQVDDLREWYISWGSAKPLERPDEGPCAAHGAHADMPGIPTWGQRTDLSNGSGAEAEELYLSLMPAMNAGVIDLAATTTAADAHSLVRAAAEDAIAQAERDTELLRAVATGP